MPGYSHRAQPFLDAIADGVFASQRVRDWILAGTKASVEYSGAEVLLDEHRAVRWRRRETKQPFWANYPCGKDARCTCRIEGSKALESDAIFFFRNAHRRILAVHIEFKYPREPFGFGQPESYPLRAACFARTHSERKGLNPHDDWATVLFCGEESDADPRLVHFQRVIHHAEARAMLPGYPR